MNQLRIIAGKWRGRKISFIDQDGLRPSPNRVRETLFNWLQTDIVASNCLDLFAGSGALSFEAASRGANHITCLELNAESAVCIKENLYVLQADQITLLQQDALNFLKTTKPENKYDLAFLDPPFSEALLEESCNLLERYSWLTDDAKIYLESDQALDKYALPTNWELIKQKKAGQVYYGLCQRSK